MSFKIVFESFYHGTAIKTVLKWILFIKGKIHTHSKIFQSIIENSSAFHFHWYFLYQKPGELNEIQWHMFLHISQIKTKENEHFDSPQTCVLGAHLEVNLWMNLFSYILRLRYKKECVVFLSYCMFSFQHETICIKIK